ncbi:MAG: ATP-binding cassette domain-containing protein [Bacteroidetes bacterium]|nr:ATP-binding cassette domain-containing protein [Bacteroidota bacterium]
MKPIVLDIKGLSKQFSLSAKGAGKGHAQVISDLNLSVNEAEVCTILGSNGAGKTTLFNLINGFTRADSGSIRFFDSAGEGHELTGLSTPHIARLGINRMLQGISVFGHLSMIDNLQMARPVLASRHSWLERMKPGFYRAEKRQAAEKLFVQAEQFFDQFSICLAANQHKIAGTLSTAEQRLLSLCMMVVSPASLLLLDEPCSGLHTDQLGMIAKALEELKRHQKSILLIEHNLAFVEATSDTCHYLEGGHIRLSGSGNEVVRHYKTEQGC